MKTRDEHTERVRAVFTRGVETGVAANTDPSALACTLRYGTRVRVEYIPAADQRGVMRSVWRFDGLQWDDIPSLMVLYQKALEEGLPEAVLEHR